MNEDIGLYFNDCAAKDPCLCCCIFVRKCWFKPEWLHKSLMTHKFYWPHCWRGWPKMEIRHHPINDCEEEDYDAPHVDVDAVKANLKVGRAFDIRLRVKTHRNFVRGYRVIRVRARSVRHSARSLPVFCGGLQRIPLSRGMRQLVHVVLCTHTCGYRCLSTSSYLKSTIPGAYFGFSHLSRHLTNTRDPSLVRRWRIKPTRSLRRSRERLLATWRLMTQWGDGLEKGQIFKMSWWEALLSYYVQYIIGNICIGTYFFFWERGPKAAQALGPLGRKTPFFVRNSRNWTKDMNSGTTEALG